ncbi:hypothetical protein RRG08_045652, partial [Elysia crispata]
TTTPHIDSLIIEPNVFDMKRGKWTRYTPFYIDIPIIEPNVFDMNEPLRHTIDSLIIEPNVFDMTRPLRHS